jgi:hypothetical protein
MGALTSRSECGTGSSLPLSTFTGQASPELRRGVLIFFDKWHLFPTQLNPRLGGDDGEPEAYFRGDRFQQGALTYLVFARYRLNLPLTTFTGQASPNFGRGAFFSLL